MITKSREKEIAVRLRREGKSYRDILVEVPVAKSTISLWLRDVGLSRPQKQKLTEKRLLAAKRGAETRRAQRLAITKSIYDKASLDVDKMTRRDLWLAGVMLYWAEGSKEKEDGRNSGMKFANSDYRMLKIFLKWLTEVEKIDVKDLTFEVYIHENSKNNLGTVREYWSKALAVPGNIFRIYLKKDSGKTNRKNTGTNYYGLVRINVKASSVLNRRIAGWINAITKYWGVV